MTFELARQVSLLPRTYEGGDKSTASLLRDAAHPDALFTLPQNQVAEFLTTEPGLVDLWFRRGGDQRICGGWGIEGENGHYRVQSFSDETCLIFQDRIQACAAFIVRYVAHIVQVHTRSHH